MRVALATCARLPDLDEDGPALVAALAGLGVTGVPAVWDDPRVDWGGFDLVVVRSTWDYSQRRAEFLGWAHGVERLANPAALLDWNTDKAYLRDLAGRGVPVVPTQWVGPGEAWAPPAGEFVVKPAVGAGARDAARYRSGEPAEAHVARLHAAGRTALVQPYLPGVDTEGETALLYFDGRFSHAARKGPLLQPGAGVVDTLDSRSVVSPRTASADQLAVAAAVLAELPDLLYARVDLVPGTDGSPLLLELEVSEPSLFLRHAPGSAARFAEAIRSAAQA